jgi:integrase
MRTNTAQWLPNQNRWQIKVQKDGVRRTFTSAKAGRTGQREANAKADAWLDEGICSTTKRCWEVWKEYLISVRATAGTSYAHQVEKNGRNYILPVIGTCRIGDLNTGMLQDVLNRAYKEGCLATDSKRQSKGNLSKKTLQGIRGTEVAFVKWARQHKYTTLRPEDEELTVPKGARKKGRKILQPDSLRVLLSTDTRVVRGKVEQDENVHAYRLAVMTGLRPGELLGLCVGDLDDDRLRLARAINAYNEETSGKNENAIRTVVLHPLAVAELRAQLQQRAMEEERPLQDDDRVFELRNEQSLYNYWRFYQRCNGIDPPVSLYELRHTFVSMVSDALSPAQLRRMVGHSHSMDTYGWYSHAVDGRDETAALTVSGVLSEYAPGSGK